MENNETKQNLSGELNQKDQIHDKEKLSINEFKHKGKEKINDRIKEIENEWDVDRTLLLNAAGVTLAGAVLGAFVNKKWFLLSAVASLVMAEHAITGWSPDSGALKILGKRTHKEINRERYALKALKGDFKHTESVEKLLEASE
jgi:hypothetical protein